MKFTYPLVMLGCQLIVLSLAAIVVGGFSMDAFVFLYGLFGLVATGINLFVSIGLAFSKEQRKYIPALLLSAVVVLITALFSLSQVSFSR